MNANCCEFAAAQRMSRNYALRSRGCHCHWQVVTAAPFCAPSSSASPSSCCCPGCLESFVPSRTCCAVTFLLQRLMNFIWHENSRAVYCCQFDEHFWATFVLALAATWTRMPWQQRPETGSQPARKHTVGARNYELKITKIVYTMRQRGMRCPPQL